jgi:hypothetical protein
MSYVSAYYAPPIDDPMMQTKAGEPQRVIATDDQGQEWHLAEDSQAGEWLRYIDGGGTIEPFDSEQIPLNQRITSAPDTLFGGPTIAEVLGA